MLSKRHVIIAERKLLAIPSDLLSYAVRTLDSVCSAPGERGSF